jgi:hypothetical protein
MFKQLSGTNILHVPYKGNPQAITDLLGGQIDFMIYRRFARFRPALRWLSVSATSTPTASPWQSAIDAATLRKPRSRRRARPGEQRDLHAQRCRIRRSSRR